MVDYKKELSVEKDYLNQTIFQVVKQLENEINREENEKIDIISSRREMWENASPSSDDIDSMLEASQYKQFLNMQVSNYMMTEKKIKKLENMLKKPYFARVNFIESGDYMEKIYIGLSTLIDDDNHEIYVYDWRSPISSIFYRYELGKVSYQSPMGEIDGEVLLKRQYEIKDRKLQYFFDSNIQITDEFLGRILSQNTSTRMKTIVETIQREQDIIIRDQTNDLLIVHGVAGSGKTSIALHRVAYLMYQGLESKLSSQNIIIISPNPFFAKYIENVLPELGEENVKTLVFEDFFEAILKLEHGNFQPKNQFLEELTICRDSKEYQLMKSSMEFKSSEPFIKILQRFICYYEHKIIQLPDVYYDNQFAFSSHELKSLLLRNSTSKPLVSRLKDLERLVLEKIRTSRQGRMIKLKKFVSNYPQNTFQVEEKARLISIKESGLLYERIKNFSNINYLNIYKSLFENIDLFYRLSKGLKLPTNINEIIKYTQENLSCTGLMYEDYLSLLFLKSQTVEYNYYKDIKQVVIDEAQDYYPIHFEILKSLFPKSKYTVLGDYNQTIEKQEDMSFYGKVQAILEKKKTTIVSMNKSFRSTREIISFSSQFLDGEDILESFNREGDIPKLIEAENQETLVNIITAEILECQSHGFDSIGILCKSKKESIALFEMLNKELKVKLLNEDSNDGIRGVFIIPIYMAKGLEFDAVIIAGTDDENYKTPDDKKLLYIGCTRALHRLTLVYSGRKSRLINRGDLYGSK